MNRFIKELDECFAIIEGLDERQKIDCINKIKIKLHEISPFKEEPVDCVIWVNAEEVEANDYNPNTVAPPEMELLEHSIQQDGYTQPIVAWKTGDLYEVVDGFHRNRIGKESEIIRGRVKGYLPITIIKGDREQKGDRIAATIRHNRARGKHRIDGMAEIVLELKRRNWSDKKIGMELGMDLGHTWQSFAQLLVKSMPPKTKTQFENKIRVFCTWWQARGYENGIPDEAHHNAEAKRLAPSWRRVCKSLLRNDYWCRGLASRSTRAKPIKNI